MFKCGIFFKDQFDGKKRSNKIMKTRLADLVEWPLGEPKLVAQPWLGMSDHTQVGLGSLMTILMLLLV